jgi:hypothetical protein
MAIGQLFDYRRYVNAQRMAILVPSRPRSDLLDLCRTLDIDVIWPEVSAWHRASTGKPPPRATSSPASPSPANPR